MRKLFLFICCVLISATSSAQSSITTFSPGSEAASSHAIFGGTGFSQPIITTFSPTSDTIGSSVTITGSGFNPTASQNIVFFGATRAVVTAASSGSLTVTVPLGATYQYLSVTNLVNNLTAYSAQPFIVTYPGYIWITTNVDSSTGLEPITVCTGDIDGDGKPDLVVSNSVGNSVSVLRNTSTSGTISFAFRVDLAVHGYANSVCVGDIDGDGKLDLAVTNSDSSTISVLRNTSTLGTISFAPRMDFAAGAGPSSISIGDIDADGKPDLAITNAAVSVLRNTSTLGNISFAPRVDFTAGSGPKSIVIGDLDRDNKPDLAIVNTNNNTVSAYRNTSTLGTISFAPRVNFTTGSGPTAVNIGDIDGDNNLDLVTTNFASNTISIFRNTSTLGTISFAPKADNSVSAGPASVSIGDIDGNGKPDLVVGRLNNSSANIFRNNSTPGALNVTFTLGFFVGSQCYSTTICDIDGDGKSDLVGTARGDDKVAIARQIAPPPVVTSFTPSSGCANIATIVINGNNFIGATAVTIGGVNVLSFTVNSTTQITAIVGNNVTGTVAVTTPGGTVSSAGTFTVNPLDLTTTASGALITSNQTGAVYQWIDCSNNTAISGETNQSYTATANGDYAVVVSFNGCSDTSACVNITGVGIVEVSNNAELSIYPNPFSKQTTLVTNMTLNNATLVVYNSFGQEVRQMQNISGQSIVLNREDLPNGLYLVRLVQDDMIIAVKKLVIAD